jgi:predicted metal-binding protein
MLEFDIYEALKDAYDSNYNQIIPEDVTLVKDRIKAAWKHQRRGMIAGWRDNGINLIIILREPQIEDQTLTERTFWTIQELGDLKVAIKPFITRYSYNFRHYTLKIILPPQIPLDLAIQYLHLKFRVVSYISGDKDWIDDGTLRLIVRLKSIEEMRQLGDQIQLGQYKCKLTHKFLFECQTCKEKGHWENQCETYHMEKNKLEKTRQDLDQSRNFLRNIKTTTMLCSIKYNANETNKFPENERKPTEYAKKTLDNYITRNTNITEPQEINAHALKIGHVNICGIRGKLTQVINLIQKHRLDILAITETHMNENESS